MQVGCIVNFYINNIEALASCSAYMPGKSLHV